MDYLTTSAFKLRSIVNTLWKNTCKSYNKHKNIEGADEKRETMVLKSIFRLMDRRTDRLGFLLWFENNQQTFCCVFYVVIFITSKNTSSTNDVFVVVFLYSFSKIIRTVWYVSLSFYCTILYDLNEQQFFHNWTIETRGILEIYTNTHTHTQKETSSTSHSSRDRAKKDTNISAIPWGACRHGTRSCGVHSRVFVSWCLSVLCCYWSA